MPNQSEQHKAQGARTPSTLDAHHHPARKDGRDPTHKREKRKQKKPCLNRPSVCRRKKEMRDTRITCKGLRDRHIASVGDAGDARDAVRTVGADTVSTTCTPAREQSNDRVKEMKKEGEREEERAREKAVGRVCVHSTQVQVTNPSCPRAGTAGVQCSAVGQPTLIGNLLLAPPGCVSLDTGASSLTS